MVPINWTNQSKSDLKGVAEYVSRDSVRYAKNQLFRIRKKTSIFRKHPHSGRIVPEFETSEIRELFKGNYRIIYRLVNPQRIDILTIHHSSRRKKNIEE